MHTANAICTQPTSEVILCTAKSEKNFQDAIMLVILPKIDLHLLKAALIFCLRYRYCHVLIILQKEFKNLFPIMHCSVIKALWKFLEHLRSVKRTLLWQVPLHFCISTSLMFLKICTWKQCTWGVFILLT